MAFTTVTGSNGITSLVGTTGVDTATIVTLNDKVFVGGNTGNDTLTINSGTGNSNSSDYDVRMGGGDDDVVISAGNNILNSLISLDGETLGNDGDDSVVVNGIASTIINSEIRGMGGQDNIEIGNLSNSIINGNSGNDDINGGLATTAVSNSSIYGGQGIDTIAVTFIGAGNEVNGNKGSDTITVTAGTGGTISSTFINGGQGDDSVTLVGATIDGNTISGDKGNDTVVGSNLSDDLLFGGDDNDNLTGLDGADTLTGGSGVNTFNYTAAGESSVSGNAGFDTITDLKGGALGDIIDFGNLVASQVSAITFIGAGNALLGATLEATLGNVYTAAGGGADMLQNVANLLSITAPVSFAGEYVVGNQGLTAGAFAAATTQTIEVNSVATLADNNVS